MQKERELNIALFIDFDNVALGARDAGRRFDIHLLLQKVLDRGKIIIKRAYADWHYYKEHIDALHQAAIELIEVPSPRISGKNSADIRLVVDAMDLCYSKDHIDTFVIVSGDSDFSPLVSKLRENDKRVVGIGMRNSSSKLLIGNCDEFIFFDDLYHASGRKLGSVAGKLPQEKRKLFEFLVETARGLLQESRGNLYSSLIKDTMKRKRPDFNEGEYGYSTFGDLLEDARVHGLLDVVRDNAAGGTWVVAGLGESAGESKPHPRKRSRGSRGRGGRRRKPKTTEATADGQTTDGQTAPQPVEAVTGKPTGKPAGVSSGKPPVESVETPPAVADKAAPEAVPEAAPEAGPKKKAAAKKKTVAKKTTKKKIAKKTAAKKKTTARKPPATKKKATKRTPAKKTAAKKPAKKAAKKKTAKKAPAKKTAVKAAEPDPNPTIFKI